MSTVTGAKLAADADLRQVLFQQMTTPVRFAEAVGRVAKDVDLWIEVGPGHVLTGMMTRLAGTMYSWSAPAIALDAGGSSLKGLLKAFAAAFALGAPVSAGALFEDRFHRPFDPAHQPRFLANPCEQAPASDGQSEVAPSLGERAVASASEAVDGTAVTATNDKPLDVVRRLAAQRAELPVETVGQDLRLLGDLHLSSIAVAQLVTESARALGLEPPVWPTEAANATIAEVAEALEQLAGNGAAPHSRQESLDGIGEWTRPFTVELVECPPPTMSTWCPRTEVFAAKRVDWKIIAEENDPLRAALPALLDGADPGGGVAVCLPPEPDERQIDFLLEAAREVIADPDRKKFLLVEHGGGAAGFARTLHLEHPELTVCVVDAPLGHTAAAAWIAAEASAARGYVEAHYDAQGTRREPHLRLLDEAQDPGRLPLGPEDVLLVTGGGKGIGAECALALARASGARLALVGRSHAENDAELTANLRRFSDFGVEFRYDAADITDTDAVRRTVQEIEARLGLVTGVLHSAGANVPQRLDTLDPAAFLRTLKPKVHGLQNVLQAVSADRLRLLVAFGSIIARTGMPGEADYAVANQWLTRLVERWQAEHIHCRCLSVEWSVWSGVGMGERLGTIDALRRQGISPISPDAGVAALKQLLARRSAPVAVIVTGRFGEPPTLKFDPSELPLLRFLERIRLLVPGVELIAEADLSLDTDPYLSDHVYQGAPLFPAVMGLEAMAQAAKALAKSAEIPTFEEVALSRPVVVPRDASLTIRLVALQTGPNRVEVALRSQETNFQADHFKAVCVFGPEARAADLTESIADRDMIHQAALPLDPNIDLYGGILFQRGRLQRVRSYRHLRATECVAEIQSCLDTSWFSQYLPRELVLGDPGARDATIHGIQACIPHGVLLPTGVDRLTIFAPFAPAVYVHARERSRHGDDFVYDVDVTDEGGVILERWQGLQLRCIRTRVTEGPWAAPLLATYLQRRVYDLIPDSSVSVALQGDASSGRHAAGTSAVQRALGASVAIHRRGDGKPEACVLEGLRHGFDPWWHPGCGGKPEACVMERVSASHAGNLTLAICGEKAVACDLEAVAARADTTWRDLLGPQRQALADLIAREAREDHDTAATRVWCAGECLKKAGLAFEAPLVLVSVHADGWVLMESGAFRVATCIVAVRSQPSKLSVALLVES
ncbi:MAG: SDR family NAD(P)-dependent oxidoreductase [Thermoguttaceae bacterium]